MAKRKKKRRELSTVFAFMSEPEPNQAPEDEDGLVSLWEIRPDPDQPRTLLPILLDEQFKSNQLTAQEAIKAWQALGSSSFENLRKLADSIAQHGLINPITVQLAPQESTAKYLIVTGERRWWAHVLLASEDRHIHTGKTTRSAEQIKISLTAEGTSIRAHQLIENLIREDLNAVEKARGMWALRLELSGTPSDVLVNLASPPPNLVPWTEVEKALDISSRYRGYITAALQLTDEAQRIVQEHQLSESLIRPIVQKLSKEPELQMKALEQLLAWQEGEDAPRSLTRAVRQFVQELLAPPPPPEPVITATEEVATAASSGDSSQTTSDVIPATTQASQDSGDSSDATAKAEAISEPVEASQEANQRSLDVAAPSSAEEVASTTRSLPEAEEETPIREPVTSPSAAESTASIPSQPAAPSPEDDETTGQTNELSEEINQTATSLLDQLRALEQVPTESWALLVQLRDKINALAG